ncbi:HNH endonuclease [Acinetobacter guillouiae]|uniref:HNH endonuclease n=1 Tax=Acinetobacter guillouiae TaxID=106649 RepID=UPI0021D33592|nr:HNH endonuclease signature motif containing protein [Acinetobacter guillouiae]MCU4492630.1 HNH endonuclease [Acinetobacter guillouiae]
MSKNSSSSIQKHRNQAFILQYGLCFYCHQPMWISENTSFISKYRLKPRKANLLQCTAEHLKARQDGGSNSAKNIVAACKFCNNTRHKSKNALDPELYGKHVRKRLLNNNWHQIIINPI